MSRAFVKEDVDLPERSGRKRSASGLPPGATNYITARGAKCLRDELDKLRAANAVSERVTELEQILAQAPEEGTVLAPAADGRGTNAAFRRPANLFPLRFGNDSFKPHLAAAQATGKPCIVLQLPSIAVDVDNPEDLQQLLALPGETRTQSLLRRWVIDGRLHAVERERL